MALNLTAIAQTLRNVADQLDGTVLAPAPGGKASNPVQQVAQSVPPGYESGTVRYCEFQTSKKGKQYLSLGIAADREAPLRFVQVWDERLQTLMNASKGKFVHYQLKAAEPGRDPVFVADIYQVGV